MANEKVVVDLEAGNNTLGPAIDDAAKKASRLEKILETTVGVFAGNLLTKAFDGMVGGLSSVIDFTMQAVDAAAEQEAAINRLSQALKSSGSFSKAAVDDLVAYSESLQQTTKYSDDAIVEQLALAKSFGATNKQAKDLVLAGANLAAALGGTLDQRVEQLGKTLQGTGGKLDLLIPGFKGLTEEQLRSGAAFEFVNSKFGGSAASELDTYTGRIGQLKKAYGELQESVGSFILSFNVTGVISTVSQAITDFTQNINDSKIATDRQKDGFVENASSMAQLKREYDELRVKAIDLEQSIINPSTNMDKTAIFIAEKQLKALNLQIAETQSLISKSAPQVAADTAAADKLSNKGGITPLDQSTIDSRREAGVQIAALRQQLANEQIAFDEQMSLAEMDAGFSKDAATIVQMTDQKLRENELIYQSELDKNAITKNGEDLRLANSISFNKKKLADQVANDKKEIDNKKINKVLSDQIDASRLAAAQGFLSAGIMLAKDGSREQKILQTAQSIASTYTAATQALASPPGPPYTIPLAASTVAMGLANVARINAVKFEQGGIVGATSGPDNQIAQIRTGEMVLNANQQKNLMDMINKGPSGVGDVIIHVDGREIARAVRNQVQSGFRLA